MNKKELLEKALSAEDLADSLEVVSVRGWVAAIFFLFVSLAVILWSFLGTIPLVVVGKGVTIADDSEIAIYTFFPLYDGQKIQQGMDARINLDTIEMQKYGLLRGKVEKVFAFPASPLDKEVEKIPSTALQAFLLQGKTPKILAIIKPIPSDTYSGYAWTSVNGPDAMIEAGKTGIAEVILDRIHPISYLLENR